MKIIIVGGGNVGYYLMKALIKKRHAVHLIEKNRSLCEKIADEMFIPVHVGDATKIEDLRRAETQDADVFISATGKDEENLIACQLAKSNFKAKRTIARVNNPENIKVFEALGVDIAVSSTSAISSLIEEEVDDSGMKQLSALKGGRIIISEIQIRTGSSMIQKKIKDIPLPEECLLISVIKDDNVLRPQGNLELMEGDSLIAISDEEHLSDLRTLFALPH